jgi:conserved oligomeric Golgi complex subunit 8
MDDSNVNEYVRQLTDAHRIHMFDIVMQFRAIFYDGGGAPSAQAGDQSVGTAGGKEGSIDTKTAGAVAQPAASPVLASWAQYRMQLFVEKLDTLLPTCGPAAVRIVCGILKNSSLYNSTVQEGA